MNKVSVAVVFVIGMFVGAVSATTLGDIAPKTDKVVTYFNQAHAQEQAY